jgi:hypothetical protein
MNTVLRTHGGLGNQIFQVLFARLYAEGRRDALFEIHDARYKHRFARSTELGKSTRCKSHLQQLVSSCRLPKILHRLSLSTNEKISLFGTVYLDGYFQSVHHYEPFPSGEVAEQLIRIRDELKITNNNKQGLLVHLRLGDFFNSIDAARLHAISLLRDLKPNSTIITNQESLLAEPELQSMLDHIGCVVQTTEGFSPEQVLRFMSQFEQIVANDSTLTFWASVLGGCNVEFTNPTLIETNRFFKTCLNS